MSIYYDDDDGMIMIMIMITIIRWIFDAMISGIALYEIDVCLFFVFLCLTLYCFMLS